ncbi:MAG: ATP-binding protein, partial [Synergistaceae bacterium]|nr:ATP-binding protein [Synergistaceae bacterium]
MWLIGLYISFFIVVAILSVRHLEKVVEHRTSKLKAMEKEARSASLSKSAFLATMSHEIRTPMNAILGITEIQLHDESVSPDIKEALHKIYNSGKMLLDIINDILDLSKIEAGKMELTPREYDTANLIRDTAALNITRIGDKPIEFELDVDENIPATLYGDELRVKQILNNLLSNAFKYTEKGLVKLSVSAADEIENENENESNETDEINEKNEADEKVVSDVIKNIVKKIDKNITYLVVEVSDTGRGMTEEQLNVLFDAYTRFNTEASRATEGAGL